jgi:hypothetical protein
VLRLDENSRRGGSTFKNEGFRVSFHPGYRLTI